jgi:heat shock protein HslJ
MDIPQRSREMRLILACIALSACVSTGGADETALAPDFTKMDWRLVEVDGKAPGYEATLNLGEQGRITGQAPCNRYFADLTREGDRFTPGMIGVTRMACFQIKGEAEYFTALQGVTTQKLQPGRLTLSGGGHELVFVQPID